VGHQWRGAFLRCCDPYRGGCGTGGARRWTPGRCSGSPSPDVYRSAWPAGREIHLRSLQPLALHIANSIFLGDYLTSEGQAGSTDLQMIADAGLVVEGQDEQTLPATRHDLVVLRRRGSGAELPAYT
jgi:hypothetical protein